MNILKLEDLGLYNILVDRNNSSAKLYAGILLPIANDADYLLDYIRVSFQEYPSHNIQHSYRILYYIHEIFGDEVVNSLSNTEIFCVIMAALFHDTGMAMYISSNDNETIRNEHHKFSTIVLERFFKEKMQLLEYRDRLKEAIIFACEAHGMDIEDVYNNKLYNKKDKINGDKVRFSLIASFLRIGDLLDLDVDRVNEFALSLFSDRFPSVSLAHNERHLEVDTYFYSPIELNIRVKTNNIDEYMIWSSWFEYITKEILYINTYLNNYNIKLPKLEASIEKNPNANYEIEELRFEIDSTGGIWDILSKSIYTDEFDFIRELIQNAIDATLLPIYMDKDICLNCPSPRDWDIKNANIYIGFSNSSQELYVIDTGIGMDFKELKNFLFKISSSGYINLTTRSFGFPSISKFGIGFVSCLINASTIEIFTRKENGTNMHYVDLDSKRNLAIMQNISEDKYRGTTIRLKVNKHFSSNQIQDFIKETFIYASVSIVFFDVDRLQEIYESILKKDFNNVLNKPYIFASCLNCIENKCNELRSPLSETIKNLNNISYQIKELYDWIFEFSDYAENHHSDKKKVKEFLNKLHEVIKSIKSLDGAPPLTLNPNDIKEYTLFTDNYELKKQLEDYKKQLDKVIAQNEAKITLFNNPTIKFSYQKVSFNLDWKYCVIELNNAFKISNIVFSDCAIDLTGKKGIVVLYHEVNNFNEGFEYASINSFLFSNGEIVKSIYHFTGSCFKELTKTTYEKQMIIGLDEGYDYFEALETARENYEEIDPFIVDDLFSVVLCKNNNFYFYDNISKEELHRPLISSLMGTNFIMLLDGYLANQEFEESFFANNVSSLYSIFDSEAYDLCQDGIHLSNDLRGLFPIGFSKISCNLTCKSRLNLNITRHKISETENNSWVEDTAFLIQKTILSNVKKMLLNLSLTLDPQKALSKNAKMDFLSRKLRWQFNRAINDFPIII